VIDRLPNTVAALLIPARCASKIDPQQALREMQFEVICSEARGAAVRRRSSEAGHHNAIPTCCNGPGQAA